MWARDRGNSHIWWKSHFWPVKFFCDSGRNMKWRRPQINDFCMQQVIFISWEPALWTLNSQDGVKRSSKKNIFTHKQWFFVILENKDITKLPINLSLIYFWQLFGVNLLQSLNDYLWKKTCEITKSNVPIRDKMFRYSLSPKCKGGQTVWPYYDLDSMGTASCALPVQCALLCWESLYQFWGQARPLLQISDNTSGVVTTITISKRYGTLIINLNTR